MINSFKNLFLIAVLTSLALCGCSNESRKARILNRADKDFAAGQFEKAEIEYLNALRLVPGDPTSIRQLGTIYFTEGRILEAYKFLQRTAEIEPENLDAQLRMGMAYLTFRKTKEARAQAEKILVKRPGDEESLLLLAEAATTQADILAVQQQIEQLRRQDKEKASYHLALGGLFLRQQQPAKAEREFKSAQALEPNSETVQLALGSLYWSRHELDQAEKAFQSAAQNAPWRSLRRLKLAEFQLKNGKIDAAKKTLEEMIKNAPDYFPAWSFLIQIAFAEKKFDDCATLVAKVLSRDPTNFDALRHSASLKLVKGDFPQAVEEFERINKIYQQVPEIQFQLARAYLLNGETPKAVKNLNLVLSADPNFTQAILLLAEIQIRQGDSVSAIPQLTQLVHHQPNIAQAHLLLASAYLLRGKTDEALAVYREMTTLFPKDPQPPTLLGIALMIGEKRTEARKAFEKSLEIEPDYLPALEQLLQLDVTEKDFAAATNRVRQQIEKNPATAQLWIFLAKIQLAQKNQTEAETSLQKALALNPDIGVTYTLLAQLYADSNRQQEALKKLTEVSGKTNNVAVLMQIGMIHDQLKNFPAARDSYEKILVTRPEFSPALNNLAYLYSEHLGQLDKAYEMAQKARQLQPYDPSTADTLGWILFKRRDYSRAIALLQESASQLPKNAEIQFHVGMTCYMMGDEESARPALEKALQSKEEFPGKAEIAQRLTILRIEEKKSVPSDVAVLKKQIEDESHDVIAANRLAGIYERNGAIDDAVKICENSLKNNPGNARILLRLAGLYAHHRKDSAKALDLAKQARNASPDDPNVSRLLSRLAYDSGDYPWALSLAQDAARKLPAAPDLNYDLARCYYAVGNVAAAQTSMQSALATGATFPGIEDAKRFLAMMNLFNNPAKMKAAGSDATQILKSEPNYIPALMVSAVALEQSGNYQEAKKQYEKILGANPLFVPVYLDLTLLCAKYRIDDPKAYDLAAKAREAFPENPDVAKILGTLAYGRKEYARAAQLLEESSRKKNQDAELFYYLGLANYNLKKSNECREALKQALNLNLAARLADDAKKVLAELR
jgi:tetratricopeptide (TPR) repeat protein